MMHELKTWPQYFQAVYERQKNFEIRKNDREFKVGDTLFLREFDPKTQSYTGEDTTRTITYILDDPQFVKEGYVVMSIE